jgi:hypothetical protein
MEAGSFRNVGYVMNIGDGVKVLVNVGKILNFKRIPITHGIFFYLAQYFKQC